MVWLRDSGILNKLYEDALNAPAVMPYPKVRINQPLNISQLGTAFMVVAGGLVLGILALLVERFFPSAKIKSKQLSYLLRNTKQTLKHNDIQQNIQFSYIIYISLTGF